MQVLKRDEQVVRLVAEFRQMTATQIRRLVFAGCSRPPFDRSVERLLNRRLLRRVGRLAPEGGGSGAWVYTPARLGWRLAQRERHEYRSIRPHMLATAEVHVTLVEAERQGRLRVHRCQLEVPVGQARADMLLEVAAPGTEPVAYYVEVEVCDKDIGAIHDKCAAYVRAWDQSTSGFPYVLFVAPDIERLAEIEEVVHAIGEDGQLFRACLIDNLGCALGA